MFNIKTKHLLLIIAFIFLSFTFTQSSETGIKLSFDTQLLNILKKVDMNSKFSNMTLIGNEGYSFEKKSFPSVYMNIKNLTVNKLRNPEDIIIDNDKASKSLQITFKNFMVQLKATYDLKIASILKDQGKDSMINIELDNFLIGFQFTNERVLIKSFNFTIKSVDIKLNQWLLNLLKKLFMGMIIKKINKSVDSYKSEIEEKLNLAINAQNLIDLGGMGIGINSTITEIPNMDVYEIKNNPDYLLRGDNGNNGNQQAKNAAIIASQLYDAFAESVMENDDGKGSFFYLFFLSFLSFLSFIKRICKVFF